MAPLSLLYKVDRYDVKGRKLLKTLNKYYLVDLGLRTLLMGQDREETGHMLENLVYFELPRRCIGHPHCSHSKRAAEQNSYLTTTRLSLQYVSVARHPVNSKAGIMFTTNSSTRV